MVSSTFSNISSIAFPTANYLSESVNIKQSRSTLEQGVTINTINALSDAKSTTINNYTSHYLSDKKLLSEIIEIPHQTHTIQNLVTQLVLKDTSINDTRYLYFISQTSDDRQRNVRAFVESDVYNTNNTFFELEILSGQLLRVKHNNGLNDFYLNYNNGFVFYQYSFNDDLSDLSITRPDMFRYILDSNGYLQLYQYRNDILHVVTLSGDKLNLTPVVSGSLNRDSSNMFYIDYNFSNLEPQIDNGFVSYDIHKQNTLSIDTLRSDTHTSSQLLLHTAYNTVSSDQLTLNYLELETDRSEYSFARRGSNTQNGLKTVPGVDFRGYQTIHTGADQERGNENISLTYTFYDKDFYIKNDTDTVFKAPDSIYPYKALNINDSTFVENGSFSAPTPDLADKIYVNRDSLSSFSNGRYLCTWLSASNSEQPGVWVDRYYYPDKISKSEALAAYSYSGSLTELPSFQDSIDYINLQLTNTELVDIKIFDKLSDACIEPNCTIKYSRVGNNSIQAIIDNSTPTVSGFTSYYTSKNVEMPYNSTSYTYDGTTYTKFNAYNALNNAHQFTISFDTYIDPSKVYGYQIFGNNTNAGFGIFSDKSVTPFIYVVQNNNLFVYNTSYELVNNIQFDANIKDVIKYEAIDNFIVTCENDLIYRVNSIGNKLAMRNAWEIHGYTGYSQEKSSIYFTLSNNYLKSLDINTLVVSDVDYNIPSLIGLDGSSFANKTGVVTYKSIPYNIPSATFKYENSDVIFYSLSNILFKHPLYTNGVPFAKSTDIITSYNTFGRDVYFTTKNKLFSYNTNGIYRLSADFNTATFTSITGTPLSGGRVNNIDIINEYVNGVQNNRITYLCEDINGNLYLTDLTNITSLGLSAAPNSRTNSQTNYNWLNLNNTPTIDFKLTLQNYLSTADILTNTIKLSTSNLDAGYHTFTYRFDGWQGNIDLFVDSKLYGHASIKPGKYMIQDIFNDELYAGTTGFYNGVDLATYLKQPGYYYVKDLELRNMFIYDKALTTTEIYALNLLSTKIDDLVLALPAGQRNNKEQIERFFKFKTYNSSKNIDIVIKNLHAASDEIKASIRNSILSESKSILPIGVKINDIKFINYI